jgi:hypothetical protein
MNPIRMRGRLDLETGLGVVHMFTRYCLAVGSSSYATAIFPCSIEAARSVVPDDYFTVAEVLPGQAMFFVGTGEFRVADIGPYKEMYIGFYTENRARSRPTQEDNLAEFSRNESKMYMWKNWVTTRTALERMDEAGSTVFRQGSIDRTDRDDVTRFSMEHESEGRIGLSVPRQGDLAESDFFMKRTHYGRLKGVPSRVDLHLNIDRMVTAPGRGELEMTGPVAEECASLAIPEQPLVSIWIEEMNFKMTRPMLLPGSVGEG